MFFFFFLQDWNRKMKKLDNTHLVITDFWWWWKWIVLKIDAEKANQQHCYFAYSVGFSFTLCEHWVNLLSATVFGTCCSHFLWGDRLQVTRWDSEFKLFLFRVACWVPDLRWTGKGPSLDWVWRGSVWPTEWFGPAGPPASFEALNLGYLHSSHSGVSVPVFMSSPFPGLCCSLHLEALPYAHLPLSTLAPPS